MVCLLLVALYLVQPNLGFRDSSYAYCNKNPEAYAISSLSNSDSNMVSQLVQLQVMFRHGSWFFLFFVFPSLSFCENKNKNKIKQIKGARVTTDRLSEFLPKFEGDSRLNFICNVTQGTKRLYTSNTTITLRKDFVFNEEIGYQNSTFCFLQPFFFAQNRNYIYTKKKGKTKQTKKYKKKTFYLWKKVEGNCLAGSLENDAFKQHTINGNHVNSMYFDESSDFPLFTQSEWANIKSYFFALIFHRI